ncbi:MAG: DPP IV N-terminal domain-containing protein [Planctomycetes bacterium]|nr:DPP IV N-terminal domain-containing protein [Planctomycetota bacterium]
MKVLWLELPIFLALAGAVRAQDEATPLRTVAEATDYRATSGYADVVEFCRRLDETSPAVRALSGGTTGEGRDLPLLVLSDPTVGTAAEARKAGKLVVFAFGAIHAGEVCGKEALLALARDIATGPERALLDNLVLLFLPVYNADGNERVRRENRPGQVGPEDGMGIRENATGLDLNRDFTKLEAPETRSLVRLLREWDPAIVVDTHTTNGSRHRYALTYDSPRHPACPDRVLAFARDELLPEVSRRLAGEAGIDTFFYGDFSEDSKRWETYPPLPRYSTHYVGLRNRLAILSEAYAYAPFRERVESTYEFLRQILRFAAANRERIAGLLDEADEAARALDPVPVRCEKESFEAPFTVRGFEAEAPRDFSCLYDGRARVTESVKRPLAYVFPARLAAVAENLQRHGIEVEELREDALLDVEVYRVEEVDRAAEPFQGHRLVALEITRREEALRVEAGALFVGAGQPLGTLAAYLLEPRSQDGLAAWDFLDGAIEPGGDYPILRLVKPQPTLRRAARRLAEERPRPRRVTFDDLHAEGPRLDLSGDPVSGIEWLDTEHFLQTKEGELWKVGARTGRSEPFSDRKTEALLAAVKEVFKLDDEKARELVASGRPTHDPSRGRLLERDGDLWYGDLGGKIVRLTSTPVDLEHVPSFDPLDRRVAFVRGGELHVALIEKVEERRLTRDGGGGVSNGETDWVYMEEVYGRGNTKGYWWSPDGTRIAFLQFDDRPVPAFTVVGEVAERQTVETTPYPRAGDPNPLVRLGIAHAEGGEVSWADLSRYAADSTLIVEVGWLPGGESVYFYAQDRAQTWLDYGVVGAAGGEVRTFFRETTGKWVENPGPPRFMSDGSFLLPSERTGWNHLYRRSATGELLGAVTSGEWEVREVHLVDEAAGWVYFSGTKDSPIATNLYRARLDGSETQRLTFAPGSHSVTVAPDGNLFVDSYSDRNTPARVDLRSAEGALVRRLDTNPVHELADFDLGRLEFVQIPAADGFVIEGSLLYPPDFDPSRKYPVWFTTYGGPHAPTVRDAWHGGRLGDQMLAAMGIVVFSADPRSASGKGAVSTWTAYRRLGVQELADVEQAIRWLVAGHPWVDPERIGIGGHSYGGFLASYAMTHSPLFACGIAGAPVTDWRLYDSIYTERYMDTPQANPEGYDATSVVKAAANLHGRLLLIHGATDDNVHVQNTLQLASELQRHGKDFELMIYPASRHGIGGKHYQRLVVDFLTRTLAPEGATSDGR